MELALLIAQIFNSVSPGIAQLIILLKKKDGSVAVIPLLDEADEQFEANIQKAREWLEKNKPA